MTERDYDRKPKVNPLEEMRDLDDKGIAYSIEWMNTVDGTQWTQQNVLDHDHEWLMIMGIDGGTISRVRMSAIYAIQLDIS